MIVRVNISAQKYDNVLLRVIRDLKSRERGSAILKERTPLLSTYF